MFSFHRMRTHVVQDPVRRHDARSSVITASASCHFNIVTLQNVRGGAITGCVAPAAGSPTLSALSFSVQPRRRAVLEGHHRPQSTEVREMRTRAVQHLEWLLTPTAI